MPLLTMLALCSAKVLGEFFRPVVQHTIGGRKAISELPGIPAQRASVRTRRTATNPGDVTIRATVAPHVRSNRFRRLPGMLFFGPKFHETVTEVLRMLRPNKEGILMRYRLTVAAALLLTAMGVSAEITAPPSGNNQHASVTQYLGLVKVTIDYNSPRVHSPFNNEDRRGKIWGTLVPYGMAKGLGYGTCTECPWRLGANENTVFTTSNDIKVQGQPLAAGSYGMSMVPSESGDWTLIFSKNASNWGSFFYDPSEDALRVKVTPSKSEYHEYLTFEFPDRQLDKATAAMKWEDIQVPFTISVDNISQLYVDQMRRELHGDRGFQWNNWANAARYALDNKIATKEALDWAKTAATNGFPGQENFTTLTVLADAQAANGMTAEAAKTRDKAMNSPTATALDLHLYGRQLLQQGKKQEALAIFELNAKKHPNEWPVNVGLARGYSAMGRYQDALKYAKLAAAQAPDENNKKSLQAGIEKLQQGKDMNQ